MDDGAFLPRALESSEGVTRYDLNEDMVRMAEKWTFVEGGGTVAGRMERIMRVAMTIKHIRSCALIVEQNQVRSKPAKL